MSERPFAVLQGKTLDFVKGLKKDSDEVLFETTDGHKYQLSHDQNCCEDVRIEDICGDVLDLLGSPLLLAEEVESTGDPQGQEDRRYNDSHTWTFYKLSTIKGSVTIRWLGESNGCYSESVQLVEIMP